MRLFLSIMPAMDCIVTDHRVADFGSQFTTLCESLGIEHGGSTPRRSQAQGNIEVANRIFQNSLAKQCATANGRKTWEKFLPRSVQVINSFYPYKSRLSRLQLLMSPFYFCAGQLQLVNPIAFQKCTYKNLNEHRIKNLLGKRVSDKKIEYKVGQFVTVQNQIPTQDGSQKLPIPLSSQLYKITAVNKEGFLVTVLNISTLAEQTVLHSRIKAISLENLDQYCLNMPELFDKLVSLRRKMRNMYIPGRQTGANLCQVPFEAGRAMVLGQEDEGPVREISGDKDGDALGLSDDFDENIEVEDLTSEDLLEDNTRVGPDFHNPSEGQISLNKEPETAIRYNTRFKGAKHVKVSDLN